MTRGQSAAAFLLVLPALLVYATFVILPTVGGFYISLTDYDLSSNPKLIGLANYGELTSSRELAQAVANTGVMFIEAGLFAIPISFVLAHVLNQRLPGMGALRTIYLLPLVVSGAAIATIYRYVFFSRGVLNSLLSVIHPIQIPYLSDPAFAIHAVSFIMLWSIVPLNLVFYLAALQTIPRELQDAARIDGAGAWGRLRYISWPLATPTTFILIILNVSAVAISSFDLVNILTKGQPQGTTTTILYLVYREAFLNFRLGFGSAMGMALFAILLVFSIGQFRLQRRWAHYQ